MRRGFRVVVLQFGLAFIVAGCPQPGGNTDSRRAFVSLGADPAASVTLDGELVGNTPLRKLAVDPGAHTVVLECVACEQPQSRTLAFSVEAGEIYTHDCTRFEAVSVAEVVELGAAGAYITVNTKPWSTIYLDGVLIGNTPKRDYPVEPGSHEITFKCGPCNVAREEVHTLEVEAGETWTHTLVQFDDDVEESTPEGTSSLSVNVTPWGTVHLDGVLQGKSPLTDVEIASGEHHLRVLCGPCVDEQDESVIFNVAPGAAHQVDVTFEE